MLGLLTKIIGSSNERTLKKLRQHIDPINALESTYEVMSDSELRAQTDKFRERLDNGEPLDNLINEAFAVVREAAKRTLKQRHYDVQIIGGLAMHHGEITEMKTGEGKTLVSTLPAYLNAISGKGVHIVTVNDYLAQRDANWMGEIYRFLDLSVGCITANTEYEERQKAYNSDITYGTNNEFGFDYLRDNMRMRTDRMVQREFNFAIIDEVDSILIDEARTPLIISGPSESSTELYTAVDKIIPELDESHYEKEEKHKTVVLTEDGTEKIEELLRKHKLLTEGNMYDIQNISLVHHANQALRAHKLFYRDTDYIIKDNKVMLIDEFTGRMMDGRRLSEGLHQAIEAKEGVEIQTENQTLASITFQNYFRLYPKISGMTGTALTEAAEFEEIYKLGVVEMPTNVPVTRIDYDDQIYKSLNEKDEAVIELIKDCQERKQPILVGTVSIEKSENLSKQLKKLKIKHKVLNARYHEQEANIISQAGKPAAITIATNMAGRGTDIQLGGNADMRIKDEINESWSDSKKEKAIDKINAEIKADKKTVINAGGLYVIGTERHESRRIDNQLRGRSGRQGDPGTTIFFLSVEDDLMRIFAGDKLEALLANKRIGLKKGEALEHPLISKMLERAQNKVESMHFEVRKNLLKFDDVMNDQRKMIYEQRKEVITSENICELTKDMRYEVIEDMVANKIPASSYSDQWDIESLNKEIIRLLAMDIPVDDWAKEEGIADSEMLERIIDSSDKKMAAKAANNGAEIWASVEKSVVLRILDQHWKEHLLNLDHLRQGINLRAFGQRDPLNEYKTEAFAMFEIMLNQIREGITQMLSIVELSMQDGYIGLTMPDDTNYQKTRQDPALAGTNMQPEQKPKSNVQPMPQKRAFDKNDSTTWGKVPRNSPCPCGSGKKFKHCHGKIQNTSSI
ncbi:MAG: preprotein translocase subunit SecA [Alphaproteobacteria bacterium]|nr:preprotein translocase subunit SecA [Alphaproteobacteria bacterium]